MAIKLAQLINEETKTCAVALNDNNPDFYRSIGFAEMDVEYCEWNCTWYLNGCAPEKPSTTKEEQINALKAQLNDVDDKSNRSMRAILANTATEDDRTYLANLEAKAADLRIQIHELEVSEQ